MTRLPSRVFVACRAVRQQIVDVGLPASPVTGRLPEVSAASISRDQPDEWVTVVTDVGDDASIEWRTVGRGGGGRTERFRLRVVVSSNVAGVENPEDVERRLEELAEAVQAMWFHPATGVLTPPEFDGVVQLDGPSQVSFVVWPTDEGFGGQAEVVLGVQAHI